MIFGHIKTYINIYRLMTTARQMQMKNSVQSERLVIYCWPSFKNI